MKEEKAESAQRTPYAVKCWNCAGGELVYMTREFYLAQMQAVDYGWVCPRCFENAIWDDENYDWFFEGEE
jgi:hypothetical protein